MMVLATSSTGDTDRHPSAVELKGEGRRDWCLLRVPSERREKEGWRVVGVWDESRGILRDWLGEWARL